VGRAKNRLSQSPQFKQWPDKVYSASFGYEPKIRPELFDQKIFTAIMESIFTEKRIQLKYKGGDQIQKIYSNLHPIGLYRRGSTFYMVAYKDKCDVQKELPRQFAIHRIIEALPLKDDIDKAYRKITSKELEKLGFYNDLVNSNGRKPDHVDIRLSTDNEHIKFLFSEWEFQKDQKTSNKAGVMFITFTSPLTEQFKYWVRSFNGEITLEVKTGNKWKESK
jgi:hypothetical protein